MLLFKKKKGKISKKILCHATIQKKKKKKNSRHLRF